MTPKSKPLRIAEPDASDSGSEPDSHDADSSLDEDQEFTEVEKGNGITLREVVHSLGSSLVEVLIAAGNDEARAQGVVIYDGEESLLPPRSIILAITVYTSEDLVDILTRMASVDARAVIVRSPVVLDPAIRDAVEATGVALLGLPRGASWTQLAFLLGSLLGLRGSLSSSPDSAQSNSDLYSLADVVSQLLGAPTIIQDRDSQVLAFSEGQDHSDQARIDTIIGRKVPASYTQAYHAQGIFRRLYREDRPVFIEPVTTEELPRVAVAIKAGNEILGSIWAAVHGPLSPEREQAFVDGAKLVALHMLRQTATADVSRRLKAQRVLTLLEGGPSAADAARAHGLSQPAIVWAWGYPPVVEAPSPGDAEVERRRVLDALSFQVSSLHPWTGVASVGDTAYVILPVSPRAPDAEADSVRIAQAFLNRTANQFTGRIGVSRVATTPADLATARREADRALRVLRDKEQLGLAKGISELDVDALLLDLRDFAAAKNYQPSGPVAKLLRYDSEKGSELVPTLRAWLDCFGDVRAAAAAMQVHTNTFRYRLRRVLEVGEIDHEDLAGRFALMVQLRLLGTGSQGPKPPR